MFFATDISSFLACAHTATLKQAESRGEVKKHFFNDPTVETLRKLGQEHEQKYLRHLAESGLSIVEVDTQVPWATAAAETVEALRQGVDVVYQATFLHGSWGGRADFLVRTYMPSSFGAWSYEVVETKLARSTKAGAIVQLCFYSDMLSAIQGVDPHSMHVVLGGGVGPERFAVRYYLAYFRKIRTDLAEAWALESQTYPEPTEHCAVCSWYPLCDKRRRDDDHLSLVAGITGNQRKALIERGIKTVVDLGSLVLPVEPKIERIGSSALVRIREQAHIQVQGREEGHLVYELLEKVEPGNGLTALPAPSEADVFLDLEADPFVMDQGLEYLIGMLTLSADSQLKPTYQALWSFNRNGEKKAFEEFIGFVMERWRQNPAMHIYHYAPYEPTAIKRLVGRHGTCIDEVDELLRAGIFVDLFRVVRQSLRASVESYSIKQMEPLYGFNRTVPLRDARLALQSFESALAMGAGPDEMQDVLRAIEGYNCDDCVSAFQLREWLEQRRTEVEAATGQPLARPELKSGEASEKLSGHLQQIADLKRRLLDSLPADETKWTDENRACWLLAQCLSGTVARRSRLGGSITGFVSCPMMNCRKTNALSAAWPTSGRWGRSNDQLSKGTLSRRKNMRLTEPWKFGILEPKRVSVTWCALTTLSERLISSVETRQTRHIRRP